VTDQVLVIVIVHELNHYLQLHVVKVVFEVAVQVVIHKHVVLVIWVRSVEQNVDEHILILTIQEQIALDQLQM
jgi:hypothetical protein